MLTRWRLHIVRLTGAGRDLSSPRLTHTRSAPRPGYSRLGCQNTRSCTYGALMRRCPSRIFNGAGHGEGTPARPLDIPLMTALENSEYEESSSVDEPKIPLLNEKPTCSKSDDKSKKPKREHRFREVQRGIWTLYYPITDSWREYLPALESLWVIYDMFKAIPVVWRFVRETLSLGPIFFTVYFLSSTLGSFLPAVQLYNNSNILALVRHLSPLNCAKELF